MKMQQEKLLKLFVSEMEFFVLSSPKFICK